jgi:hypothetical protein
LEKRSLPVRVIHCLGISVIISDEAGLDGPLQRIRLPPSFGMGDVINLRTSRKQARRQLAEQTAAANRLAHGRSKTDRERAKLQDDKSQRTLDQHRIETGDGQ